MQDLVANKKYIRVRDDHVIIGITRQVHASHARHQVASIKEVRALFVSTANGRTHFHVLVTVDSDDNRLPQDHRKADMLSLQFSAPGELTDRNVLVNLIKDAERYTFQHEDYQESNASPQFGVFQNALVNWNPYTKQSLKACRNKKRLL